MDFLSLTTPENTQILVGISNITTIKASEDNPNFTRITFNYTRYKENLPAYIDVKEEFQTVKNKLVIG